MFKSSYGGDMRPGGSSFWAARFLNGKVISERDMTSDHNGKRPIDWTLDLVTTGDILKVTELWLITPANVNPFAHIPRLVVTIPGSIFQFKIANLDAIGAWGNTRVAQVIGMVTNLDTGDCIIMAYDEELKRLIPPYQTNVQRIQPWRDGLAPVMHISTPVLGMDRHF